MSQLPIFRQSSSPISPSLVPPFGFLVPASYLASCEDRPGNFPLCPRLCNAKAILLSLFVSSIDIQRLMISVMGYDLLVEV